jgi:hypothetical protein
MPPRVVAASGVHAARERAQFGQVAGWFGAGPVGWSGVG